MMIIGKNVMVTGGAGFIGSHLVDGLFEQGAALVVVVDNFFLGSMDNLSDSLNSKQNLKIYRDDASDYPTVHEIIKLEKIDIVFNLATKALIYSFFNPNGAFTTNVNIASALLQCLKNGEFSTLVHLSSSEVYGTSLFETMDERHPLNPTTPYAAGKAAADLMIQSYYNLYQLDIRIVRPFNNYGPRQNEGSLAAIIPFTVNRILNGQAPVIEGTGKQTRDFIYVKDTVDSIIEVCKNDICRGEVINIASGNETSVNEVIESICSYFGYKGMIERKPERTADVARHCAGIEKAKKLGVLGKTFTFNEGIYRTLEWYKKIHGKD